tara:strand:+ start:1208 stop:1411 length:204 start_codon:yes stop_codon:yes gene_type:complete
MIISKYEPDSPGKVIPEILIIPQKKMKINELFSISGLMNVIDNPNIIPINVKINSFNLKDLIFILIK